MTRLPHRPLIALLAACALLALAGASASGAAAQKYTDVTKKHWAYASITAVTERGPAGHKVLDDYGELFKPEEPITRELLARSLVLASGHYGEHPKPVAIKDMKESDRYWDVVQVALEYGYMRLDAEGEFRPQEPVPAYQAEAAVVRWLQDKYHSADWSLLKTLRPTEWEPNDGWKPDVPVYFPYTIAARHLELRYNHPAGEDAHETLPTEPIDRAEIAYMFQRAYALGGDWQLYGLADYRKITFPTLSDRQKQIVAFALKYVGYPYVWAGEYPTRRSPYGTQASGGFDCSGFVFYVMQMHFDYPITVNERGASDMAKRAKPRIKRKDLLPGDPIFFAPQGPKSKVSTIYHAGLYLGNGWFIHSTGSSDGVTLDSLDASSYYKKYFAWGRRLLTPDELPPAPGDGTP
jgi:cell wall-associated NlpC family hydrolase